MLNIVGILRHGASSAARRLCTATLLAVLAGTLGLGTPPGQGEALAARLEGQRFDDTMVLADRTLRLNGLGLRGVAWIKAFVTGLYLPAPSRDVAQILAMPGPKRLRMKVMLEAPSKEYSKAFAKGVRRNEPERVQAQLAARLGVFVATIDGMGTIKKGDTIDMDFVPGQGTQLRLNNKPVGHPVEGDDFYRALLKIYIGDKPADPEMKEGLLRGGSSS